MFEKLKDFFRTFAKEKIQAESEADGTIELGKAVKNSRERWEYITSKFKSRRSIRKFSSQEVEWRIVYEIIEASLNGPCAGNIQNTKIIVVRNRGIIDELARAESQQYWIADASVVLVVVRSNEKLQDLYPDQGKLYAIQNSAAVIQNILMLAHFHDLGACWVSSADNEVLSEILKIPSNEYVDAVIPIGYPLEKPEVARNPASRCIYYNEYGNFKR